MPQSQAEELREVIREANGVRKDLERVIKEARAFIRQDIREIIVEEMNNQLGAYAASIKERTDEAAEKVCQEFVRLERLFLGTGKHGQPTLEEVAQAEDVARRLHENG
jgi:hypothetical protein